MLLVVIVLYVGLLAVAIYSFFRPRHGPPKLTDVSPDRLQPAEQTEHVLATANGLTSTPKAPVSAELSEPPREDDWLIRFEDDDSNAARPGFRDLTHTMAELPVCRSAKHTTVEEIMAEYGMSRHRERADALPAPVEDLVRLDAEADVQPVAVDYLHVHEMAMASVFGADVVAAFSLRQATNNDADDWPPSRALDSPPAATEEVLPTRCCLQ